MQQKGQKAHIILYDFLNDDADFKDSAKDFDGANCAMTEQTAPQQRRKGNHRSVLQMHPQALRNDDVGMREWLYDAQMGILPPKMLDP